MRVLAAVVTGNHGCRRIIRVLSTARFGYIDHFQWEILSLEVENRFPMQVKVKSSQLRQGRNHHPAVVAWTALTTHGDDGLFDGGPQASL
jgi:hypothetical protein